MPVVHTFTSSIWMQIISTGGQCPTSGFRFLQPDEIKTLAPVWELSNDAEDGYIYEVDLHYTQHLHNANDDYSLAPKLLEIGSDMYSPSQHAAFPQTAPQRKLTPNVRDKCGTLLQPEAIPPIGS